VYEFLSRLRDLLNDALLELPRDEYEKFLSSVQELVAERFEEAEDGPDELEGLEPE
jgi:hypothetical protein